MMNMNDDAPDLLLRSWFEGFPGRHFLNAERHAVGKVLAALRGEDLVQLGAAVDLPPGPARRSVVRVGWGHALGAHVVAELEHLPFWSDSVDIVVVPHILELHANPHQVLREAHRVLTPEGHIVIAGFTPWSLLGILRLVHRGRGMHAPRRARPLAAGRVSDWLALLGYELVGGGAGMFEQRPRLSWRELRNPVIEGQPVANLLAGLYVLVARKRVMWVRPVVSRWQPRRLAAVGLAEPTMRGVARQRLHR